MINNNENAVKIAVRERPSEEKDNFVHYNTEGKPILVASGRAFAFDHIFQSHVLQKEVYDILAYPLVKKAFQGYNCNIFAYGQTGTGKTYTMGLTQNLEDEYAGLIPRCLNEVFLIRNKDNKIYISYIEIYNEKVFDMLSQDPSDSIYIKGCKFGGGNKKEVKTSEEAFNFLLQGNRNRHVRPTKMNAQSSRSHAIFTIHVEEISNMILTKSMLNLIDLAGSEGVRRTGHQGIALSEGVNINQGLLSVGKVIQALNSGSKVIPYRDSILTSVLQESLNVNSYLTLLACISSENTDKSETLYTLRFAQSAKSLRNNPLTNAVLLEYQKFKQKTPSKFVTPLRTKNINTPYIKNKSIKSITLKKSHSFCSPRNIHKFEINKFNNTEILKKDRLPERKICTQEYETINNYDNVKRSTESRLSITSLLNASTSTALETSADATCLKVVKSFKDFERISEEMFENIFQKKELNKIDDTEQKSFWKSMKDELRDIIREELISITKSEGNSKDIENKGVKNLNYNDNLYQINEQSDLEPKKVFSTVQEVTYTEQDNKLLMRSNKNDSNKDFYTFDFTPQSSVISYPRRSHRLSKHMGKTNNSFQDKKLRRSCRLEAKRNESFHKIDKKSQIKEEKLFSKKQNGRNVLPTTNKIISNYFNNKPNENSNSKAKHQKAVLDILNNGTIKELQILPYIGLKTAYQIMTHRTLNGKFKNFGDVSKLPVWRGKAWERFKEANNLHNL